MSFDASITAMTYPSPRILIGSAWLRAFFRLPPVDETRLVIGGIALQVRAGEIVSIIGPSGAGKTTLLRILAGLERRFDGTVCLDGAPVEKPSRRIQMVFQEHRLFPWFNVEKNLFFAAGREAASKSNEEALALLDAIGLGDKRQALPKNMSDGERTRVAFIRALTCNPSLLLLDEPFRALDQVTKEELQDEFISLFQTRKPNMAVLMVSHSISDAVFLSDRVIVVGTRPLRMYKEFCMPNGRIRRDPSLMKWEHEILKALRGV